ncbi:MAG TPA: isocitrate lyase/phosphoenolpyruvate mutase family protein [Pyrinomonadaceae bacterium]|jgi:2-methylisocitrate lyase-like PEP mutase family enzyme|nr:isocitrate lyase/phosphoenolpyruvate mutase family protein [Pyrinomonadaceae bacterium]
MSTQNQLSAVENFRALHVSGCFLLPNPFDVGSAVYLHHLGFQALATSSAGFAFTQGLPDDPSAISREIMLDHIRDVVFATPLPVNADFQDGYAREPEGVAESVRLCVATGVAGLSIEDSTGDQSSPLYEDVLAVERIQAARAAIDQSGTSVLLTARCEAFMVGHPNAFEFATKRLVEFAEAGADCLYAPGVTDRDQISAIVKAVSPKPVNVLAFRPDPNLTVARLTDLGVRRISVGSGLSRVAWGAFIRAARSIASTGEFEAFAEVAPYAELNGVFSARR